MASRRQLTTGAVVLVLLASFFRFLSARAAPHQEHAFPHPTMVLTATRTMWDENPTRARYSKTLLNRAIVHKLFGESQALKVASTGWVSNGEPAMGWGPRLTVVFREGPHAILTVVDTGLGGSHNPLVLVNGHAAIPPDEAYLHDLYAVLQVNRARLLNIP